MRDDDEPRRGLEQRLKRVVVEESVSGDRCDVELDCARIAQAVERSQHRIVRRGGGDRMVARVEQSRDGGVERLGRVGSERHARRVGRTEELRDRKAGAVDRRVGLKRRGVHAAADAAERAHGIHYGVDDLGRFGHRSGRVVEIDHRSLFPMGRWVMAEWSKMR